MSLRIILVILAVLGEGLMMTITPENRYDVDGFEISDPFSVVNPHIIGGKSVGNVYYQVSLRLQMIHGSFDSSEMVHFCGGSLLRSDIVLTAAHCLQTNPEVMRLLKAGYVYVVAGTTLLSYSSEAHISGVKDALAHPMHDNSPTHPHDIAVLKLKEEFPVNGATIGLISLRSTEAAAGTVCSITGWGNTRNKPSRSYPSQLQAAHVPLIARDACAAVYGWIREDKLCAGYDKEEIDPCPGDSGGPLVCDGVLTGVISMSYCGAPKLPAIYSSVAHHKQWIEEAINTLNSC